MPKVGSLNVPWAYKIHSNFFNAELEKKRIFPFRAVVKALWYYNVACRVLDAVEYNS